ACDRHEDKQEKKLRQNLPELQAALQAYAEANAANDVILINEWENDDCEDWLPDISQPVTRHTPLDFPVDLLNGLAEQYGVDCQVGYIEVGSCEPVSYFGKHEGKGEAFLIAEYLGL